MKTSLLAAALYLLVPVVASAQDTVNNLRSGAVVSNAERNLGRGDNGNDNACNGICNALEKACGGATVCTGPGGEYSVVLSLVYYLLSLIYATY